jgi:hypothetical protein
MGGVDIVPIEAKDYDGYKLICAVGYNKALSEDMDKLESYVENGGKLFMGIAQLTTTTLRDDIENYKLDYIDHSLVTKIAPKINFVDDSLCGAKIRVNNSIPENATILVQTDSGNALIYEIKIGDGKVYLLNTLEYAGNPAIYQAIRSFVASLSEEIFAEENVWVKADDKVEFAVYEQEDGSKHIYFLAIDWFDATCPTHTATLRIHDFEYSVNVRYGTMIKAVISSNIAAWFDSEDCDVLEVSESGIKVQGIGHGKLFVAKSGEIKTIDVDFSENSVLTMEF